MNPSPRIPNPSFTFLQPIPNPNPNPNSFHPPPSPSPSPSPDLPSTLSTLKHLLHHFQRAIDSLLSSSLLLPTPNPNHPILIPCNFNPHHRIPFESLFRHSLICPSPLDLNLDDLQYPHTLTSFNRFIQTPHTSNSDLCFQLHDKCIDIASNFFYRDCPSVVSSSEQAGAKWTFSVPRVLSANLGGGGGGGGSERDVKCYAIDCLNHLSSDLFAVRNEVELWSSSSSNYPHMYSYVVLSAVMCCPHGKECDLKKWVVMSSPRYGVVIDMAMGDHIVLLFRLSLKAIVREAFDSVQMVANREVTEHMSKKNLKRMSFKCPVLVEAMKWLASQLSVLYGEVNGKIFAINILKQCLLTLTSEYLLTPMEKKVMESTTSRKVDQNLIADASEIESAKLEEPIEKGLEYGLGESESANRESIFVFQIAAAVAALHERALLEEKIKALRLRQPLTKYQMMSEHAYVSKRAEEERQKRPNYRPILEHDGLLWQRSHNQEANKTKTREELLAEERDYKRRRISYHGKKLKRTTTQVMRDIIEEYMEEIKQAGGIGCFVKGAEGVILSSDPCSVPDNTTDADRLKRSVLDPSEASRELRHGYVKETQTDDIVKSFKRGSSFSKNYELQKQEFYGYGEQRVDLSKDTGKDRRYVNYSSRNPDKYRGHDRADERTNWRREQDDMKVERQNYHEESWVSSKDTRRRNADRNHKSDSVIQHVFDDRYDPSESQ